jgi:hypothetical protein
MRRFLAPFLVVTLLVAVVAVDARAAQSRRGLRSTHTKRAVAGQHAAKPSVYPRVRQIDGKSLWDLGMQKGQWPQLP